MYRTIFSHEALRKWYLKLKTLFVREMKHRRAIAVDETKVKLEKQLGLHMECYRCG